MAGPGGGKGGGGGGGKMVDFGAGGHWAVVGFLREGLKAGGGVNGKSGLRVDYSPTYYAAFLIDPDGNNIEAVCLKPEK